MYGRGAAAIAEQIHGTKEEAQKIVDDFYAAFPQVKTWMDQSLADLKKNGYVEDFYGRRRRLPDINLPSYEFKDLQETETSQFNPFINCKDREIVSPRVLKWQKIVNDTIKASNAYRATPSDEIGNKKYEQLVKDAAADHVLLSANTARKAQAARQCVNARIQGSAADLTKLAMIDLAKNEELKKLGFRMLVPVHDEIIAECPEENAKECSRLLAEVMSHAAEKILKMPFNCDVEITREWYGESIEI